MVGCERCFLCVSTVESMQYKSVCKLMSNPPLLRPSSASAFFLVLWPSGFEHVGIQAVQAQQLLKISTRHKKGGVPGCVEPYKRHSQNEA